MRRNRCRCATRQLIMPVVRQLTVDLQIPANNPGNLDRLTQYKVPTQSLKSGRFKVAALPLRRRSDLHSYSREDQGVHL